MMKSISIFTVLLMFSVSSQGVSLGERSALLKPLNAFQLSKSSKPSRSFANFDPNLVKKRQKAYESQIARIKNMFSDKGIDIDTDGDGKADFFRTYEKGRLTQIRKFSKSTKHPIYVAKYRKGEILAEELYDFNSDGVVERKKSCNAKSVCEYLADTNLDGKFDEKTIEKTMAEFIHRRIYKRVKKEWRVQSSSKVPFKNTQSGHSSSEGTAGNCDGDCWNSLPKVDLSNFKEAAKAFEKELLAQNRIKLEYGSIEKPEIFTVNEYGLAVSESCQSGVKGSATPRKLERLNNIKNTMAAIDKAVPAMVRCASEAAAENPVFADEINFKLNTALLAAISRTDISKKLKIKCPPVRDAFSKTSGQAFFEGRDVSPSNEQDFKEIPKPVVGLFKIGLDGRGVIRKTTTVAHELLHIALNQPHTDKVDSVQGCADLVEACLSGQQDSAKYQKAVRLCGNRVDNRIDLDMSYRLDQQTVLKGFEAVKQVLIDHHEPDPDEVKFSSLTSLRNVLPKLKSHQQRELLEIVIPDNINFDEDRLEDRDFFLELVGESSRSFKPPGLREEIISYINSEKKVEHSFSDPLAKFLAFYLNGDREASERAYDSLLETVYPPAYDSKVGASADVKAQRIRDFLYEVDFFKPLYSGNKPQTASSKSN